MAEIIKLPTFSDPRGSLTVVDKILPFDIKRIYFMHHTNLSRGGHRHYNVTHAVVSISGSCRIDVNDGNEQSSYILNDPETCLILHPHEWRDLHDFSQDSVVLVMSSTHFDPDDYIEIPYE